MSTTTVPAMSAARHERFAAAAGRRAAARARWSRRARPLLTRGGWALFAVAAYVLLVLVPALNLLLPAGHPFHLSDYLVTLAGKIMCYAIVALAMDLIWGYAGHPVAGTRRSSSRSAATRWGCT